MKKQVSVIFFVIFCISAGAQMGPYKKILSERATVNKEVFYDQLIEFQKEYVDFSNVYFQLGKLELNNFLELDPIVDRVASRQRIYNSKTNYGLAKNYLDEKEIPRNPEWYDVPDIKDKDSLTALGVAMIDDSYENTGLYATLYEELISNYDRAVYHYLQAREGFIEINTSADNLRQLFLKADDSLKIAVKAVGLSFDSSMYHIDIYRDIYQQIPYKKVREVKINKRNIDHFRMNGITPANFLADDIDVWDYKQWSERFLNLLKEEVDGLQDEIKTAYKFFIATNDRMINGEECIQAELDDLKFQRIINLITKYDNESVLIDIFNYLISKLSYGNKLTYERNCNDLDVPPTDDFLSRKARIYQNLFSAFQVADSLNGAISTSGHGQESFQWFFDELMAGDNGSGVFANQQKSENDLTFKTELAGLLGQMKIQEFKTDSISEQFAVDSVFLVSGSSGEDSLLIDKMLPLRDSLFIFNGKLNEANVLVGASPFGEDYQMNWKINTYKNSDISYFKIVGDSSFVAGGINDKAWFSQYSSSGGEFYTSTLKSADSIIEVKVNQLQGIATVLQKNDAVITLSKVNFNGKVNSSTTINVTGKYAGMVRQDQMIWIFTSDRSADGSVITAFLYDEKNGELMNQIAYNFESSLENPKVIKNDNEYLTVLSVNSFAEDEIAYALLNYEGEIIHETIF